MNNDQTAALMQPIPQYAIASEKLSLWYGTFQALYEGLAHIESEMHRHVHLENEILFPRALAMAENLQVGIQTGATVPP